MEFIDLKRQYAALKPDIDARMAAVLEHGCFIMGPEVAELEGVLAGYTGSRHCIAMASGTDALLVALMALGVGPGDEVITSPFTFISTGEVIALLGAVPVFVDIDPETYNLDPALVEAAIGPATRAIMPVSLYGQCADFDAINAIAEAHGLPVIEDAAQSFGATCRGRRSCALSTIGCTSFFPSKPLGCYGDGGACFTDDDALAEAMREIRVHGQERRYHHTRLGINARMDTLQAAVLLAKMPSYPDEVAARARIGQRYSEQIRRLCPAVTVPTIAPGNTSVYAQYSIQVDDRDQCLAALKDAGVPTAVHYPVPLHRQPVFATGGWRAGGALGVSEAVSERVFSLPMHPFLDEATQDAVVNALAAATAPLASTG
ncbi:MAG: DegT/DnrJ/EryC1/StrS family aminotransferase [Gammaproteobacteria bacterium]